MDIRKLNLFNIFISLGEFTSVETYFCLILTDMGMLLSLSINTVPKQIIYRNIEIQTVYLFNFTYFLI